MNTEIKVLENSLINKIAAGEVIERPASIVKELVENSIDAGATNIIIEIKDGGTSLIKITDNGSGIKKSQLKTAFLRHATSKLKELSDLDSILTLGFRGEALSSIAAISQVDVITKTKSDVTGTKLSISGGNIISEDDTACLDGTTFIVKNIFFNTPARRKFLKKNSIESGYISEIVNRLALGHPHISFKYINNNTTMIQTSGNNDMKNTILNIYGKDISQKIIPIENSKNNFKIYGFIGLPELSRGNRNYENFFINGRYIKSSIVTNAIEEAYLGKIMIHKFPVFVINLTVPENTVDVNVHPTKLEVRFEDEDFIFEFMKNSVEKALKNEILIPEVSVNSAKENFADITETTVFSTESQPDLEEFLLEEDKDNFVPNNVFMVNEPCLNDDDKLNDFNKKLDLLYPDLKNDTNLEEIKKENSKNNNEKVSYTEPNQVNQTNQTPLSSINDYTNKKNIKNSFFNNYKIIGQIFNTYWIIEQNKEIFIIDQHSAHEKAIYEDFIQKFKTEKINNQPLLQPIVINVSDIEKSVIEENFEMFLSFGFEIEAFGLNSYAIRGVPFIFKGPIEPSFFLEILDALMDKNISNIYDMKLEKIISMSCKKAVKANDKLSYIEAKALIEQILTLENPFNCPHGRPTIIKMTKYEIEKLFKRIQN